MKTGKVVHEFGKEKKREKGRKGEGEKQTSSPQASPVSLRGQATITRLSGTLDLAGAVQIHRIDMKKGQQLGIQITTEGKTKFEPVLTLTDKAGRVLAESYDGHLGHRFAEAGSYSIGVRDRDFRGGPDFKYRLGVGEIPIVARFFQWECGITRRATSISMVYSCRRRSFRFGTAEAKPGQIIPLPVGDGVLGKAQIVVGEFPEVVNGKIPIPGTANGRIQQDNEKDLWRFNAKKGEPLIV